MKNINIVYISVFLLLSSCSPFGNEPIINDDIGSPIDQINQIFQGKTTQEVVAGATNVVETNYSVPSQNYKLGISIGGQMSQVATETNGGYKVFTNIQGSAEQ